MQTINLKNIEISNDKRIVLIAGPCVLENLQQSLNIAKTCKAIAEKYQIGYIFKGSYDKANRTSIDSFRGLGINKGLEILNEIKQKLNIPVLTDIHLPSEAEKVGKIVDIIQIPAFLCRQTDLVVESAKTGKIINIKKAQFLSAEEMQNIIKKVESQKNKNILLTERGTFFGYNNLVVDFKAMAKMKKYGYPVIFDATHSMQLPGGRGSFTDGEREFMPDLARASVGLGIAGIFMEVHPNPDEAKSDKTTVYQLDKLDELIKKLVEIDKVVKS